MVAFYGSPIHYSGPALDKMKKWRGHNFGEVSFLWVVNNCDRIEIQQDGTGYKTIVH